MTNRDSPKAIAIARSLEGNKGFQQEYPNLTKGRSFSTTICKYSLIKST